jgi:hypothetical protein
VGDADQGSAGGSWDFVDATKIKFNAGQIPRQGDTIYITNNFSGWCGILSDADGQTGPSGGSRWVNVRTLGAYVGHLCRDIDLNEFHHCFSDGSDKDGLRLEGAIGRCMWSSTTFTYANDYSINSSARFTDSVFVGLRTTLQPSSEKVTMTKGTCVNVTGNKLVIDPTTWWGHERSTIGAGRVAWSEAAAVPLGNLLGTQVLLGSWDEVDQPAVNHVHLRGSPTGVACYVSAAGSDTDIALVVRSKNDGLLYLDAPGDKSEVQLRAGSPAAARMTVNESRVAALVPLRMKAYTVSTLPIGLLGDRAFVTDAGSATFNAVAVGGGHNKVPVFHDGQSWRIG